MAATNVRANGLGFATPGPTALINTGDDHIAQNARATVDLFDLSMSTIDNIKVTAQDLPPGSSATAAVSGFIPFKTITIGVPRGTPGTPGAPGRDGMGYAQGVELIALANEAADRAESAEAAQYAIPDDATQALINNTMTATHAALITAMGITAGAGALATATNLKRGYTGNQIATDLYSATIIGGGQSGFNNIIGDVSPTDRANVGTSAHPDKTALTGSNANYSVAGGYDNVLSGLASVVISMHSWTAKESTHGTILGGSMHKLRAGDYSTILGGTGHDLAATKGAIIGGQFVTIDAASIGATAVGVLSADITNSQGALALGGEQHTIDTARYAVVTGLRAKADRYGMRAHAAGYFTTRGDAQATDYLLRRRTTTTGAATMTLDGAGALLALRPGQTIAAKIVVAARAEGADIGAAWTIDVAATRAAGSTPRLLGSPTITKVGDAAASSWAVTVAADTTGGSDLRIRFAGDATYPVRAVARVISVETTTP